MIILTYWEYPAAGQGDDPDSFEGIAEIRLKSVKQIPALVAARPARCKMISTEHSAERKLKCGRKTNFFKEIWRVGQPVEPILNPVCPFCRQALPKH